MVIWWSSDGLIGVLKKFHLVTEKGTKANDNKNIENSTSNDCSNTDITFCNKHT